MSEEGIAAGAPAPAVRVDPITGLVDAPPRKLDDASPRPWRVVDPHYEDAGVEIFDAEGARVCKDLTAADAGFIADAVNLYDRIEKARTDAQGSKCLLSLGVEQAIIITPPPSEAEQIRMYRDQCDGLLKDRTRFQRISYEVLDDNERLREFVRRLANMAEAALVEVDNYTDVYLHLIDFVKEGRALIREARGEIGEDKRLSTEPFGRAATKEDIESHSNDVTWCLHCETICPLARHGCLRVCDRYTGPGKKGSNK